MVLVAIAAGSRPGNAQSYDATNLRQPTDLIATWLVQVGDDPAYALASFDDSHWQKFDARTSLHRIFPNQQPQILWLRLHVQVAPDESKLAIGEHSIASALEIYANGQKILEAGQVAPFRASTRDSKRIARIPSEALAGGSFVLALRIRPSTLEWSDPAPILGNPNSLEFGEEQALREHVWLGALGTDGPVWVIALLRLAVGLTAIALFIEQRRHREYLWIFLLSLVSFAAVVTSLYQEFHSTPALRAALLALPYTVATFVLSILMYFAFLRLPFRGWVRIYTLCAAGLACLLMLGFGFGTVPEIVFALGLIPLLLFSSGYIPVLLLVHLRRGNREAGILLIPAILSSVNLYLMVLAILLAQIPPLVVVSRLIYNLLNNHSAGPFVITLNEVCGLLSTLSLAVIMVLRSTENSRQQAVLEAELAAAREVQRVIVPEHAEGFPGFNVESAYAPAQQVGGDFFQILPLAKGGMLVVVGDVAGKGLHAAMLVSVVVGTIRGVVSYTSDPGELMENLNERMIGRTHGSFSTALAAGIAADGTVTIANAGHLSPYLDGTEVELPGALPLGIIAGVRYETTKFLLPAGSRLTFYSDGVIEAQNPEGEMLGFDRGRSLSTHSAAAIVHAAKTFGQSDDITVVAVRRDAEGEVA